MTKERADQLGCGVALVGLGLIFALGLSIWPNILLLGAALSLSEVITKGKRWSAIQGALWLAGFWAFFTFNLNFWLIMILVGLGMIFGFSTRSWGHSDDEDDEDSEDIAYSKRKREDTISYRLGDAGELIPTDEYTIDKRKNSRA